jgi:hypothetical protein
MKSFRIVFVIITISVIGGCTLPIDVMRRLNSDQSQKRSIYWEKYGKVFYLDGAGNLGFGQETLPRALRSAGFKGDVENIIWTTHTGPLGDQMIRVNARLRSDELTKKIVKYRRKYPDAPVYIIGLSAGTGVAVWGVENLPSDITVDTIVLLGSSLSTHYKMIRCMRHVANKIYVIYSPNDAVLRGFIPVTGTIDGAYLTEPAGLVGLYPSRNLRRVERDMYREKIVNIPWRPVFERLGYAGGHTDATSEDFVRYYIAPKLLGIGKEKTKSQSTDETPSTQKSSSDSSEATSEASVSSNDD